MNSWKRVALVVFGVLIARFESAVAQTAVSVIKYANHSGGSTAFRGAATTMYPDQACIATVYETGATIELIDKARQSAITECTNQVNAAKTALTDAINQIPSKARDALKAEIKNELKAEVLQELIEEIKAGKLKLPPQVRDQPQRSTQR